MRSRKNCNLLRTGAYVGEGDAPSEPRFTRGVPNFSGACATARLHFAKGVIMPEPPFTPAAATDGYKALCTLESYLSSCGLDVGLLNLIKLRASQVNGCAYCIDMHWKDLRPAGESEQRLYGLDAWRESPYYTDRERAALEWTEAVTLLHNGHVPDAVFDAVQPHFAGKDLADLTL